MTSTVKAAVAILVFAVTMSAGKGLSGKEAESSLVLPDRPSPLSPITVSIQDSSIYAMYWTKVGAKFQLRLAALDTENRSVRKIDIASEAGLAGLHQSMIAVPARQCLVLFYSLGTSGSSVSGRLAIVSLANFSSTRERELNSLAPLRHWVWFEPGIGDEPTLLGHPLGHESSLAVCQVDTLELACNKAHDVPLPAKIGTFASAGGQMLWYTRYGLIQPGKETTITGLSYEMDKKPVTATLPTGQYVSGLQAGDARLLVTVNQGDPQSSRAAPSLVLFDNAGRELKKRAIEADCAIGSPVGSSTGVGLANCVRMKRGIGDQYYLAVDKLVAYRVNPDDSLNVRVVDSPTKDIATAVAFANDTSKLSVIVVDTNGTISIIQ